MGAVKLTVVRDELEAEALCGLLRANEIACFYRKTTVAGAIGAESGGFAIAGPTEVLVSEDELVVEADRLEDVASWRTRRRDEPGGAEEAIDRERRADHRHEHQRNDSCGECAAVVLAIDRDDRQNDQVGEDERDHAAEREPARPEDRGERDVADRADEREDGDQWPEHRVLDQSQRRGSVLDEGGVENARRDESGEAGQEKADPDLLPEHLPVAAEVVRDVRPGRRGTDPLPPRELARRGVMHVPGVGCESVRPRFLLEPRRAEQ